MNTTGWIAIVVSVIIAASGIAFGAIQSGVKSGIEDCRTRMDAHEMFIQELKEQSAVTVNELEHINKKLDKILNGE